jgi:ketosteroid isomerase-like protein
VKPLLLFSLAMVSSAVAQEPDSSSALFQIREAERNFARASIMRGCNAAFVENLADDSRIFTTTWLSNGKQYWKDRNVSPVALKWEPEFMALADSRDFGISTGPWEAQEYRPYTPPIATGYFLSVWRRQHGGPWQVIVDAGLTTPGRAGYEHAFSFPPGADKAVAHPDSVNVESKRLELLERERQMLAAWKSDPHRATYASFLAPQVRMLRSGHLPTTTTDTIDVWIAQLHKTLWWSTVGGGVASSGDLGFTYGFLEMLDEPKESQGHYVRIWKKPPAGNWTIILEMMSME